MSGEPPASWAEFAERKQPVPAPSQRLEATQELPPLPTERPAAPPRPPALIGRFAVSLGGLLAAGCLLLGVGLLVLAIVVPRTGGSGIDVATGPGWPRTVWHLLVGALAEVGVWLGYRRSWPVRVAVGTVSSIAVLVVMALSWWR